MAMSHFPAQEKDRLAEDAFNGRHSIVPAGDGIDDLPALDVSDQHSHKKPACSVNPRISVFHQTAKGLVCLPTIG